MAAKKTKTSGARKAATGKRAPAKAGGKMKY